MKKITFQVEDDVEIIILSMRDRSGKISNLINIGEFKHECEQNGKNPDSYLGFIVKTIIDDFSMTLGGKPFSSEQIEASVMTNLNILIGTKTRVSEMGEQP